MGILKNIKTDLDRGALQLVIECRERLYAVAFRECGNVADADDLVSRALAKAILKLNGDTEVENLFGWLKTLMLNLRADDMRKAVIRGTEPVDPKELESLAGADWGTDEQILKNSDSEAIRQALDVLDPKYKQAMLMRYYDDFSLKEIADILRLPMGTVSRRIQIAHRLLAGKLAAKLGKKPAVVLLLALLGVGMLFGAWVSPLGDWVAEKIFGNTAAVTASVSEGETVSEAGGADKKAAEPNVETPTNGNSISETPKQEGETNMNISAKIKKTVATAAVAAMGLTAVGGETWYLAGDDGGGTSSLVSGQGAGWTTADGSQTTKVVSGEDDYVIASHQMRTPEGSDVTFGGRSLSMTGGTILFKSSTPGKRIDLPNFLVPSGTALFKGGVNESTFTVGGNCVIEAGATLDVNTSADGGHYRNFLLEIDFSGAGRMLLETPNNSKCSTVTLSGSLAGFTGDILAGGVWQIFQLASEEAYPADTDEIRPTGVSLVGGTQFDVLASGTIGPNRGLDLGKDVPVTINVAEGVTLTVTGPIGGAAGFVKTGLGTVALVSGSLSGTVTIQEGVVQVEDPADIPNAQFVEAGGTLVVTAQKAVAADAGVTWAKVSVANVGDVAFRNVEARLGDGEWTLICRHLPSGGNAKWVFEGLSASTAYAVEARAVLPDATVTNLGTKAFSTGSEAQVRYSRGDDGSGNSSLYAKGGPGWEDSEGASVGSVIDSTCDYVVRNGNQPRTLETAADQVFAGHALVYQQGCVNMKVCCPGAVRFNTFISYNGRLSNLWNASAAGSTALGQIVDGEFYVPVGGALFAGSSDGDQRLTTLRAEVRGRGAVVVDGQSVPTAVAPKGLNFAGDNSCFFGVITNSGNNQVGFMSAKSWPGDCDELKDGVVFTSGKSGWLVFGESMTCATPNRRVVLGNCNPVFVAADKAVRLDAPLVAPKGLVKTGDGALALCGAENAVTGTVKVSEGWLGWESSAALDAAALQFEASGGLYVTARTAPVAFDALPSGLNKMMFDFGDQLPDRGVVLTVPATVPITADDFAVTVKCTHPKFKSDCFSVKVKARGDVKRIEYSLKAKGLIVLFM